MSEYLIPIKIERLEDGGYLATSDIFQGLIAQGRSIAETMEIAQMWQENSLSPLSSMAILCRMRLNHQIKLFRELKYR